MDYICIDFGIDNSSHFHFRAHTNIVADSTDHAIHAYTTDSLANHQLVSNTILVLHFTKQDRVTNLLKEKNPVFQSNFRNFQVLLAIVCSQNM